MEYLEFERTIEPTEYKITNDIFLIGVYGIMDKRKNKIVYVGSTLTSFARRWSEHLERSKKGTHKNEGLNELFKSGKYQFVILEVFNYFTEETKWVLYEREKYYSDIYHTIENGTGKHCGGGRIHKTTYKDVKMLEETKEVIKCKKYIKENWLNKKINQNQRDEIVENIKDMIEVSEKFMSTIRKLGFKINRYADKRHWIIRE